MSTKKTKTSQKRISKTKPTGSASVKRSQTDGKLSILDAAARVLQENREPMKCGQMVEAMLKAKCWRTHGKTPSATLSSALLREIKTKGKDSRFRKSDRGLFAAI